MEASEARDVYDYRNIDDLITLAPLSSVAPNEQGTIVPVEQVNSIIAMLADNFQISRGEAQVAITLLFLKGAAANTTPLTLSVEVAGREISKSDIMYVYKFITRNIFLRRLAESMAEEIGLYAEAFGLRGELANTLSTRAKAEDGIDLTPTEMAWASSFSQWLPDLPEKSSPRLARLLAEDYSQRFQNKNRAATKGGAKAPPTPAPAPKGRAKPVPQDPDQGSGKGGTKGGPKAGKKGAKKGHPDD